MADRFSIKFKLLFMVGAFSMIFLICVLETRKYEASSILYTVKSFALPTKFFKDERWTWECQNKMCVRKASTSSEKTSLDTCNMICGEPQLWPIPSGPMRYGKKMANFFPQQLFFQTHTNPNNSLPQTKLVQTNLQQVYMIFNENILNLMKTPKTWTSQTDIKQFIVNVHVSSPSMTLTLETDESYTLKIRMGSWDKNYPNKKSSGGNSRGKNPYSDNIVANITSETFYGARHALETLSQLIWYDEFGETLKVLQNVVIEDRPQFPYRGLSVDTARHYFEIELLKKVVEGMSHNKLNVFHWHMTDTQSFPLQTNRTMMFSSQGAYSPDRVYSTEAIKDFVEFSQIRGVRVIIEVDAPAHINRGWEWGPTVGFGKLTVCEDQDFMVGQVNPENPKVLDLLEEIYREVLELNTNNEIFHLGSDEVDVNCWLEFSDTENVHDYWGRYVNKMIDRLRIANNNANPKHVVVWSSPLTQLPFLKQHLNKAMVVVQHWFGDLTSLVSEGFKIIYSSVTNWYLDCGFGRWRESVNAVCDPYRPWQTVYNHRPWVDHNSGHLTLGGEVCLWSEQVGSDSLETRIWPRTAAFAERVWTDPVTYLTIEPSVYTRLDTQRRRMVGRGLESEGMWPEYCTQNPGKCT